MTGVLQNIPKPVFFLVALGTGVVLWANTLNEMRAQIWLDLHGNPPVIVSEEKRRQWSASDRKIYEFMHPNSSSGVIDKGLSDEKLRLCNQLLNLPISASGDQCRDAIYSRLAAMRKHEIPDSIPESQALFHMQDPSDIDLVKTRTCFVDNWLCYYVFTDARLGTHCAGFDWNSPFKLMSDETIARSARAKLIDQLTFNLL